MTRHIAADSENDAAVAAALQAMSAEALRFSRPATNQGRSRAAIPRHHAGTGSGTSEHSISTVDAVSAPSLGWRLPSGALRTNASSGCL